jgi:RNA polymerase sigma factor (sigma-70 family)
MTPTLLHAVARKADALTPDAELLRRFARAADHAAFEELVRRHGPLVWAVCRQALPDHADAEDAFQAVFLALVRSADRIRDGRALPAWLHGVALRAAARVRRQGARVRAREHRAARPEADGSVPASAWDALVAVVHEEVQRLPDAERTAFVLCELQGVSQPDAAVRLGCPLGSVSGRLCKARQRLLERLTARGVAPAAAVGVGLTAGAASALPARLVDAVKTFPGAPAAASHAVAVLARGITEGVAMRVKLTAAAVVAAAIGLTGGAVLLSQADAQPPGGAKEERRPADGAPKLPERDQRQGTPGAPGGRPAPGGEGGAPGMPGGPGAAGGGPGMAGGFAVAPTQWEYKFVDVKSDRKVFEQTVTQHGKDGWEYVGSERFGGPAWNTGAGATPADLTLVFKKRVGGAAMGGGFGGMGGIGFGGGAPGGPGGRGIEVEVGGPNPLGAGVWGQWGGRDGVEVRSFTLKNVAAADAAAAINKALPKGIKVVVPEPNTNRILVVADVSTIKDAIKLIEDLDAKPGRGPGAPAPGTPTGPVGPNPGVGPRPGGPMAGLTGMGAGGPPQASGGLTLLTLKHAAAGETATLLKRVFPNAEVTADDRTNQLIIRADARTLEELQTLLTKLDVQVPRK